MPLRSSFGLYLLTVLFLWCFHANGQGADTTQTSVGLDSLSMAAGPVVEKPNAMFSDLVTCDAEDSIKMSPVTNKAYLYNQAVVEYESTKLEAGFIEIDFSDNSVIATGIPDSTGKITQLPVFTDKGKVYRTDTMRYNFDTKKAYIRTIITQEGEGYIHGEKVKMANENTFYIQGTAFTTCNAEHPHFQIRASKAKVIVGEKIVTGPAFVEVADVPTPLFVPFGFFPTQEEKASGFIIPTWTSNKNRGFGLINGGYFWAISPYYDLTLKADIYTQGGWAASAGSRYKVKYKYNGNLFFKYNRVAFGQPTFVDFGLPYQDSRDFQFNWTHNQDPKARPDLRFSSSVNLASQRYFQNNNTDLNNYLTNTLRSTINLTKTWTGTPYTLNVTAAHTQNNKTEEVDITLPQLTFTMTRINPFEKKNRVGSKKWYERIGINYTGNVEATAKTSIDGLSNLNNLINNQTQMGVRHIVGIATNEKVMKHFVLTPAITYNERWYPSRLNYRYDDSTKTAVADTIREFSAVRDVSLSAGLSTNVYGQFNFNGKFKAMRHVMTPTVTFSYSPDYADPFFGYYQTVQTDSLGNTSDLNRYTGYIYGSPGAGLNGVVNFNLKNTLEAKIGSNRDSTGVRKIKILDRFSFQTSYSMSVSQFNWAPLSISATSTVLGNNFTVNYTGNFDFYGIERDGTRVNKSAFEVNGVLLRHTNSVFNLRWDLKGKARGSGSRRDDEVAEEGGQTSQPANALGLEEGNYNYYNLDSYMDFNAPWAIGLGYSVNLRDYFSTLEDQFVTDVIQTLDVTASFEPTPNWVLGIQSGWDFVANDFSFTRVNLARDLHCWQLTVSWVPFGFQQSYTFGLGIKANLFKDVKYERNRNVGDFL